MITSWVNFWFGLFSMRVRTDIN